MGCSTPHQKESPYVMPSQKAAMEMHALLPAKGEGYTNARSAWETIRTKTARSHPAKVARGKEQRSRGLAPVWARPTMQRRSKKKKLGSGETMRCRRALRRAWWLHWGRCTGVWRVGKSVRRARHLDHLLGHTERRRLREGKRMVQGGGPYALCTSMQVNDKGKKERPTWISACDKIGCQARRMGASVGGRREQDCREDCKLDGLCRGGWWHLLCGEPSRELLVVTGDHEKACGKAQVGAVGPVCLRRRDEETHRHPHVIQVDASGGWQVPRGSATRSLGRRAFGEGLGLRGAHWRQSIQLDCAGSGPSHYSRPIW